MPTDRTHIPRLTPDQLALALQKLRRVAGLSTAEKRELAAMLNTAANPDNDKLETIIKTLPIPQQDAIRRIFDEVRQMQLANVENGNNNLLLLGLLTLGGLILSYLLNEDQQALQTAQILNQSQRVWQQAIQDEIAYVGGNQRARAASGADLAYLQALAAQDSASITATFNRDAQRQLERLYKDNPTASKQFFIESMRAWAEKRAVWKSLQIAFTTEVQVRGYARSRFAAENFAATTLYKFAGPPAVCKRCWRQFSAGFVDYAHTQRNATPIHPLCPHYWTPTRKPKVDLNKLWVG